MQSHWGNLVPSMIAQLISLRLKNGGGGCEAQCFIKMGKNKERKYMYVELKIKLSERRAHCVYLNLYKSKYFTINIQFSHQNVKNFHPHVQNNVRNCVQHKQKTKKKKNKQTKKRGMGEKYNGLFTHFICGVNTIVCLPGSETMGTGMGKMPWVWVRLQVLHAKKSLVWVQDHIHGYRYKRLYLDKYGYR